MVKIFKITIICLAWYTVFGCNSQQKNNLAQIENLTLEDGWDLEIIDTIFLDVKTISLHLMDYNPLLKRYVGYDASLKTIFEFDKDWKLIREISLETEGPNSIGPQCFGLCNFRDSLVAVSALEGFFIYDKDWNLVSKYKRPENSFPNQQSTWEIFSLGGNDEEDEKILSAYVNENEFGVLSQRKPLAIASFNEENSLTNLEFFGELHRQSLYLDKSKNYPDNNIMFSYSDEKKHIYRINQLESLLYIYDEDGNLLNLKNIKSENFSAAKEIDLVGLSGIEKFNAQRKNDRYMSVMSSGKLVATTYFKGFQDGVNSLPKRYAQFIIDEQILTNEISLIDPLTSIAKVLPNNKILFYGMHPEHQSNSEGEGTVFYLGEIRKKR